jgi:hypothetical protein
LLVLISTGSLPLAFMRKIQTEQATPFQAFCCLRHAACSIDSGPSGCFQWCNYSAAKRTAVDGDGCYDFHFRCPMCYPKSLGLPFKPLPNSQSSQSALVEMVAECTHVGLPFYGNALMQNPVVRAEQNPEH